MEKEHFEILKHEKSQKGELRSSYSLLDPILLRFLVRSASPSAPNASTEYVLILLFNSNDSNKYSILEYRK